MEWGVRKGSKKKGRFDLRGFVGFCVWVCVLHWVFVAVCGLSLVVVCRLIAVTSLVVKHGL